MSGPVRVLWLSKGLGPGGAERLISSLARTINPDEFDIRATYLLPKKNHLVEQLAQAGVPAICLDGERPFQMGWVGRLRRMVHEQGIDVVHIHSPQPAALARPVLRGQGKHRPAIMYTEHNSWGGYRSATRLANAATWSLDDYRLVVSHTAFDSVPRFMRSRSEVLIHGVELDTVRAHSAARERLRSEFGLSEEEVLVVTIANFREHKDYPTLLTAARKVLDTGMPVRFAAVGQGPLEAWIRDEMDRLRLGDGFRLLGFRDDALDVIAACDVFCLSSIAEGYPVALMEALALGKAVVATAAGGIPEAVGQGVEGILVPARSPEQLAEALLKVAADPMMRMGFGTAASVRSAEYDIARAARRHEDLYRRLAEDKDFARV